MRSNVNTGGGSFPRSGSDTSHFDSIGHADGAVQANVRFLDFSPSVYATLLPALRSLQLEYAIVRAHFRAGD